MNRKNESRAGSFHFGKLCCCYFLIEDQESIYLLGQEKENEVVILEESLLFSKEERVFAEGFYSLLLASRTCPRMMTELAEEILP